MLSTHLVDATGIIALTLNVSGLLRPSDRSMLKVSAWASALWSLNSLLIGAPMAAALSALGVGRQAGAAALHGRRGRGRLKTLLFAALVAAALLIALLTWSGAHGLFAVAGSLLATGAVFYLRGAALRWAMVAVNALWLSNALVYDAGWQIAANALCGAAAAYSAWRMRRS
jgi:hypothetical protein